MFVYVINFKHSLRFLKFAILTVCTVFFAVLITRILQDNSPRDMLTSAKSDQVIIIDAGHGGEDSGAIGENNVYEKNLNLELALLIGEDLKNRGYTVIYTRTEDKMLYSAEENIKGMRKISDLKNRCKITAEYENPILISIHMNSYGASKYSGLQVYYKDGSDESKALASKIQSSVRSTLQKGNNRQIKNGADLYLLKNAECTGVIIECGFLSNAEECKKLSEKEYQKELSFSIVCGIIEYINEINGET